MDVFHNAPTVILLKFKPNRSSNLSFRNHTIESLLFQNKNVNPSNSSKVYAILVRPFSNHIPCDSTACSVPVTVMWLYPLLCTSHSDVLAISLPFKHCPISCHLHLQVSSTSNAVYRLYAHGTRCFFQVLLKCSLGMSDRPIPLKYEITPCPLTLGHFSLWHSPQTNSFPLLFCLICSCFLFAGVSGVPWESENFVVFTSISPVSKTEPDTSISSNK